MSASGSTSRGLVIPGAEALHSTNATKNPAVLEPQVGLGHKWPLGIRAVSLVVARAPAVRVGLRVVQQGPSFTRFWDSAIIDALCGSVPLVWRISVGALCCDCADVRVISSRGHRALSAAVGLRPWDCSVACSARLPSGRPAGALSFWMLRPHSA